MKLLIQWAVTSSVLILIVLAARGLFQEKLSARLRYALWLVVLARLLVPFQVELPAAAPLPVLASNLVAPLEERLPDYLTDGVRYEAWIPSELVTWEDIQTGEDVYLRVPLPYDHAPLPENLPVAEEDVLYQAIGVKPVTLDDVALPVWALGGGLAGAAMLWSNLRFARRLRKRRTPLEAVDAPIPVYTAEGLDSPCLFGLFRPAVYVTPEAAEHPDTLRHVLAHELTHYAHKDHIWSLLRTLALALHWYNPLVWLAVVLSRQDGELACDEGAVARLGEGERISYGRTLVDMVAKRSLRPADLLSCSTAMTGGKGEKSIHQRVTRLVKKPETVKTALFAVLAVMVLAVVFVFAGRSTPPDDPLERFRYEVQSAASIQYCPPLYSSISYAVPITDRDLLDQAKKQLSSFVPYEQGSTRWDRQKLAGASRIILSDGGQEVTYTLVVSGMHTVLFQGDAFWDAMELEEGESLHPIACASDQTDTVSFLIGIVREQEERSWDPSLPRSMPQSELEWYDAAFLRKNGVTQLQGRPDSLEDVNFHAGYTTPDSIQLWYQGDATHTGVWVLALSREDHTLLADQPIEVFNAAQSAAEEKPYEQLGPGAFAAVLRPADVVSARVSQEDRELSRPEIQTLKDLMVRALYHQCSAEYDEEKYGQYALTIQVEKDVDYYLHDGGADGLTLSIGSEPDVVCMRHRILASPDSPIVQYIYSPELYQSIQALFADPVPPEQVLAEPEQPPGFRSEVESCRAIRVTSDYSLSMITDPGLLAQARGILLTPGCIDWSPGRWGNVEILTNDGSEWRIVKVTDLEFLQELEGLAEQQQDISQGKDDLA